jgi:hypothetical protein
MSITEAKTYIGKICCVEWYDRHGMVMSETSRIHDATFVPLYGGYLVTDTEDVRLDKIISVSHVGEVVKETAHSHLNAPAYELPLAA